MADNRITVNGFVFEDEKAGNDALKEQEAIEYMRAQINMNDVNAVLAVYTQMISRGVFHTMVGISFLKELQTILSNSPQIDPAKIIEIPVAGIETDAASKNDSASADGDGRILERYKKRLESVSAQFKKTKTRAAVFMYSTIILLICVVAMFIITLSSQSPTVLNYKEKITDEYSSWADELTERERKVAIRENELDIREKKLEEAE